MPSSSLIIGRMSVVQVRWSVASGLVCPGYLTKRGTEAISPMFSGTAVRRGTFDWKAAPWSAVTTNRALFQRPVSFRRAMIRAGVAAARC